MPWYWLTLVEFGELLIGDDESHPRCCRACAPLTRCRSEGSTRATRRGYGTQPGAARLKFQIADSACRRWRSAGTVTAATFQTCAHSLARGASSSQQMSPPSSTYGSP
jgi:hypothetical protein